MFGMSHESYLLLDAVVTIIGLIVLITKFKVHPFIALIIAAGFLGLTSGMPVDKIIKAFQDGFGGVLGFVGIILALGTMLGNSAWVVGISNERAAPSRKARMKIISRVT